MDQIWVIIAGVFCGNLMTVAFLYGIYRMEKAQKQDGNADSVPSWLLVICGAPPLIVGLILSIHFGHWS